MLRILDKYPQDFFKPENIAGHRYAHAFELTLNN